jgi:hypothetical protein
MTSISDPQVVSTSEDTACAVWMTSTPAACARRPAGPPLREVIRGFDYTGWQAIVEPTGRPGAAIRRFNRDLNAVARLGTSGGRVRRLADHLAGLMRIIFAFDGVPRWLIRKIM